MYMYVCILMYLNAYTSAGKRWRMEAGHLHQGFEAHCCSGSGRGLAGSSAQPRGLRWLVRLLVRFGRLNHALRKA
jgi:hypothetical protein